MFPYIILIKHTINKIKNKKKKIYIYIIRDIDLMINIFDLSLLDRISSEYNLKSCIRYEIFKDIFIIFEICLIL